MEPRDLGLKIIQIKPALTLRIGLSLHAKAYDPLGLVLPTRMIGNILFRKSLQRLRRKKKGKVNWDEKIEDEDLQQEWFSYLDMLTQLEHVRFKRSVKPSNCKEDIKPDLVTFCDGNPNAFGVTAYVLWELQDGKKESSLLMSKAKLGLLLDLGEVVRNELSGATYASILKT